MASVMTSVITSVTKTMVITSVITPVTTSNKAALWQMLQKQPNKAVRMLAYVGHPAGHAQA